MSVIETRRLDRSSIFKEAQEEDNRRLTELEKYGIYQNLISLKKAKLGVSLPYTLITSQGRVEYSYIQGDFTDKDNDTSIVRSDNINIKFGALVRQDATSLTYKRRTVDDKLGDVVSLLDAAVGDNNTNDGPPLRSLIASKGVFGGRLLIPRKIYRVDTDGKEGACLVIRYPFDIIGEGSIYTSINPSLAAPTDSTITVNPHPGYDITGIKWSDFSLGNPFDGKRMGMDGILLLTIEAGSNLASFHIDNISIQASVNDGYAIRHYNDVVKNINGGLYASTITNCRLKGSIKYEGSGDSNRVLYTTITGKNIGIDVNLVKGASCFAVEHCNITTDGGIFRLENGSRFRWVNNNCENYNPGAKEQNNGALVNITGESGTIVGGLIQGGLLSAFGQSDATHLIKLQNCRGTVIEGVSLIAGYPIIGIEIGDTCRGVIIGENVYNVNVQQKIIDNGIGTIGVVKFPPLQNNWVRRSANEKNFQIIKDRSGEVHISGSIAGGSTDNEVVIANLPEGFRPTEIVRFGVTGTKIVDFSEVLVSGQISIEASGEVRLIFLKDCEYVTINGSFTALDYSNAFTPE